jgi:hypothetical protein
VSSGRPAKKLWDEIVTGLADNIDLPARERTILATACAQADQNAALEETLNNDDTCLANARSSNLAVGGSREGRCTGGAQCPR